MSVVRPHRLSRRAFLQASVGLAATLPLASCGPPVQRAGEAALAPGHLATLGLASEVLWPSVDGQPGANGPEVAARAARLLAVAPPKLQGDVRLMLETLDRLAFLGGSLRGLAGLDPTRRRRYLTGWRDLGLAASDRLWAGLVRLTGTLTYMSPTTWPGIGFPGPWVGRLDVGLGLRNERPLSANPNPSWDAPHPLAQEPPHGR
ncbi:MAG: hypothetical protein VKQ33_09960 [Candidatus Sericytochromatia bacterium]|nr:hypothetical protein [Candidatus Sericytochromatia bacterium]